MTRMLRAALSVVGAAIACAILAPCSAVAGSYPVQACSPGGSPGLWTQVNTAPAGFASGNLCGGPDIGPLDVTAQGSLWAEDILGSAADIPDGARAGWLITAPPDAMITGISYYRTLTSYGSRDVAAGLFLDSGAPLEQCRMPIPFGSPISCSMPNDQVPRVLGGLHTSSLFFGVICDIVQPVLACIPGGTIHHVRAYMYSAQVTISENSAPIVTNVGGALWGGEVVSGSVPVTFSASDAGGIREQAVQTAGGQTIVSTLRGCEFTMQPPCPQSPGATLNVDTTRVPDGTQTFRLVVTDAAHNPRVVVSPPVTVDNHGPPPPVGLTATAITGSNAVALSWSNPAAPPAPVNGAMAQLCTAASCTPAVSVSPSGAAQLVAPGPGRFTALVWLLDSAGRGGPHNAAGAVVTVAPLPPRVPAGTHTRIAAVLHGRRLRASGPISGSGRVAVSWRSKIRGHTVGHGSRTVTTRKHRVRVTFVIPRRARVAAATVRVVVRRGRRVVGQARARRR